MDERDMQREYKRVFDGIHASEELKKRILEQRPRRRSIRPYIAAAGAAAAGLVIFTAVYNYDLNTDSSGVISETAVTGTERPAADMDKRERTEQSRAAEKAPVPETGAAQSGAGAGAAEKTPQPSESAADSEKKTTEDYKREALERAGIDSSGNRTGAAEGRGTAEPKDGTDRAAEREAAADSPAQTETAAAAAETAAPVSAEPPAETAEENAAPAEQDAYTAGTAGAQPEIKAAKAAGGVLLNMNSPSVYRIYSPEANMAEYSTENGGALYGSAGTPEEWDNNRYFEYIGADVIGRVTSGAEVRYTGDESAYFMTDESGKPVNDSRIFVFEGGNGSYVSVITSSDTIYAEAYLSDPDLSLSDVNGTDAVVFDMDGGAYKCYMIFNGVSYVIDTEGLDETALSGLLLSIASE